MLETVLRLLEIDSGSILIDDINIATIPRELIRERLTVIPQDALILMGTLRQNVDPPGTHSDAAIIAALDRVGLWAALSERVGLDGEMQDAALSKGQQQLLALARATLRTGKIVLLDEPTSSVDPETDKAMQRILAEVFSGRTTMTIAHRLDTIMGCDIIMVIDQGVLVEVGAPQDLIAKEDGWYYKLVKHWLRAG